MCRWLIKFTTNSITAQTKDGKTPVHLVIEQGNLECLKVSPFIKNYCSTDLLYY